MMKKITFLFLLMTSLFSFAQGESELVNIRWELQNLILDGKDNLPPLEPNYNPNLPYELQDLESVPIYFSIDKSTGNGGLQTSACTSMFGEVIFDSYKFKFTDGPYRTLDGCLLSLEVEKFNRTYLDFFMLNPLDFFDYAFSNTTDGSKRLTITAKNGDQAIYAARTLSTNRVNVVEDYAINYNSNDEKVFLELDEVYHIKLFNLQGVQVTNRTINSQGELSLSGFSEGVYVLVGESTSGKQIRKRIVKY